MSDGGRMGGDLDDANLGKTAAFLSDRNNWRGLSESERDALETEINNNLTSEQQRTLRGFRRR